MCSYGTDSNSMLLDDVNCPNNKYLIILQCSFDNTYIVSECENRNTYAVLFTAVCSAII